MATVPVYLLNSPVQLNMSGPSFKGVYAGGTTYATGDSVSYNGSSYVALQETTGNLPTDTTYWQVLANKGATGAAGSGVEWMGAWDSGTTYIINDAVSYLGSSYISKQNSNTNNLPTDISYWDIWVLKGTDGTNGTNGKEISLDVNTGYIQWRYFDGEWTNLIAVSDLVGEKGDKGDNGDNGTNGLDGSTWYSGSATPYAELGNIGDFYYYTLNGDVYQKVAEDSWGFPIFNLKGAAGTDGTDGTDGREVELNNSLTYIQWRYVGDSNWNNLVALSDLKGDKGDTGATSNYTTIEDEGTPLTARTNLNFVGDNVAVTDDLENDATVVTISGGSGGGYSVTEVTTSSSSPTDTSGHRVILGNLTGSTDGTNLIGCWNMDETSEYDGTSGEVIDSSSVAHHGTATGYPDKVDTGKVGKSRSFNGSSDYITVANHADFNGMTAFTISAWIKTTDTTATRTICRKNNGWDFAFGWGGTDKLRIWMNSGSGWEYAGDSSTQINDGAWHWVVARYDGTALKLYVDNAQEATNTLPSRTTSTSTDPVYIGTGNQSWNGELDQVCIWKRALTTGEMTSIYNSGSGRTIDTDAQSCTINLPTAVSNTAMFTVKNISILPVIIDPNSTETVDGSSTKTITTQNESLTVISDNANWKIISKYTP